jgi:hypothetical protein
MLLLIILDVISGMAGIYTVLSLSEILLTKYYAAHELGPRLITTCLMTGWITLWLGFWAWMWGYA